MKQPHYGLDVKPDLGLLKTKQGQYTNAQNLRGRGKRCFKRTGINTLQVLPTGIMGIHDLHVDGDPNSLDKIIVWGYDSNLYFFPPDFSSMPAPITAGLSPNYKSTGAAHRMWQGGVLTNGEAWPRIVGSQVITAADVFRLGIIPEYNVVTLAPAAAGASTAGAYSVVQVFRSSTFQQGLTGQDIQSNRSNILTTTIAANQKISYTRIASADAKINYIDIYVAAQFNGIDGAFYRVIEKCPNANGAVTFNVNMVNGIPIADTPSAGSIDPLSILLATDNDFPYAQPIFLEVNGRGAFYGSHNARVTATWTNGNGTVTTVETIYDGIEFWLIKKDGDTTGGINGKGSYLCRYATANTVTLVTIAGVPTTYAGATSTTTGSIYTEPNERISQLYNPHSYPEDNVNNDFRSGVTAAAKVPNTNIVLACGVDYVVARDFTTLPITGGLNYISTLRGCASQFAFVPHPDGRVYWLDLANKKRDICFSDGSSVHTISTQKIQSVLDRMTLDSNGDVWRVGFIAGCYYPNENIIRWGLYLDDSTVANCLLELDLGTASVYAVMTDPMFYPHRYLDVFTMGIIRGNVLVGQFGWASGIARLGVDNTPERFRDWVESGTLSGDLDVAANTTTTVNVAAAAFKTTGNGLKGIQAMIWQELDAAGKLIVNRTYYHCRISANTATSVTVNYVETVDPLGNVIAAPGVALPSAPATTGWKIRVGVIQSILGPKWFTSQDTDERTTLKEISVIHHGQDLDSTENPILSHGLENFDITPRDVQYVSKLPIGQQVADTELYAESIGRPKTNPIAVLGFALVDNNVNVDAFSLDIEAVVLDFNTPRTQGTSRP